MGNFRSRVLLNVTTPDGKESTAPSNSVTAIQDPCIPLNARQVYQIRASWKAIKRELEPTGVKMFLVMFERNPEVKKFFAKLGPSSKLEKHEDNGKCSNNKESLNSIKENIESEQQTYLENHARRVMEVIDECITNYDKGEALLDILKAYGAYHTNIVNYNYEMMWFMEKPFLDAVQITLGDRYSENMKTIYEVTIHFIIIQLISGYKEALK